MSAERPNPSNPSISPGASQADEADLSFDQWIREQVEAEDYFFQKIRLPNGVETPGWSDPEREKLPHYHLPDDLTGKRVLDVGCAEGFFSFEAEKRGARDVVSIDSFPESIHRFNICKAAKGSKANGYLANVYELSPKTFGTFDLVMFFGVLYHLRHPLLALERILSVCTGSMLLQTAIHEQPGLEDQEFARFHPFGLKSGPEEDPQFDPTVFWLPNRQCVRGLVAHAGFQNIETLSEERFVSIVVRAQGTTQAPGKAPDQTKAPWS